MGEGFNAQKINLDFGPQRRKSFLPDGFVDDHEKNIKVIECVEDDDLYVYLAANTKELLEKPVTKFITGSKYLGQWNNLGFSGKGVYKYPHGVIYDGYFNRNGEFHGSGMLVYPNGQRIEGMWKNGKLSSDCQFVTKGGVVMNDSYCRMPDRRFQIEVENEINPPGQEYLTNAPPPPREIPEGCYDTGLGFYDPKIKCVIKYKSHLATSQFDLTNFIIEEDEYHREKLLSELLSIDEEQIDDLTEHDRFRSAPETDEIESIPNSFHQAWIVQNCRKAWDEPVGYRPELYEEFTKGTTKILADQRKDGEDDENHKPKALKMIDDEDRTGSKVNQFYSFIQKRDQSVSPDLLMEMFTKSRRSTRNNESKMLMVNNNFFKSEKSVGDFIKDFEEINQ